jgi:proteasome accessory factor C
MPRPTGDSARDRLNLFLAIVPFVLLRGSVTVTEVADQFGTTPKRIADAVQTIACDGGANEARYNFDTELFNIDWDEFEENDVIILTVAEVMHVPAPFSAKQRAVFLAGLELLKAHPYYRRIPEFDGLVAKLRGPDSNQVTDAFAVEVDANSPHANRIQDAIEKGVRIRFTYINNQGERGERDVDPYRQDLDGGQRYLKGYCLQRNDIRTFNLDSMENLQLLETPIEPRSIDALTLTSTLFSESDDDLHVDIVIDPESLPLIASYLRPGVKPVETGGRKRLTLPFSHEGTAIRMISVLSGIAVVEGPDHVRAAVAGFARNALDAYAENV